MSSAREVVLEINRLSKDFSNPDGKALSVLDKISLSIPSGKVVSILGASGCGKTTLLKILAGIETASSGDIISNLKRPGPEIGFAQQSERLLPWRSVEQNVALGLELLDESPGFALQEARKLLAEVEMNDFAVAYPAALSGGMTQRALLARTLVTQPKLLLLDEPLGQLDIVARRALATELRRYVSNKNAAALLVTHSVEEAVFVSDIIFIFARRPAHIVDRFAFDLGAQAGFKQLNRDTCFATVLAALENAIALSPGVQQ